MVIRSRPFQGLHLALLCKQQNCESCVDQSLQHLETILGMRFALVRLCFAVSQFEVHHAGLVNAKQ
jgi:hypothetical protein